MGMFQFSVLPNASVSLTTFSYFAWQYDRLGVVGVAPEAEVFTIKVFNEAGMYAYGKYIPCKQSIPKKDNFVPRSHRKLSS